MHQRESQRTNIVTSESHGAIPLSPKGGQPLAQFLWEQGTIIIPSSQWAKFKAKVREGYNKSKLDDFAKAGQLQAILLKLHATHKGKNPDPYGEYWETLTELAWKALEQPVYDVMWGKRTSTRIGDEQCWEIETALFRNGNDRPPLKPLKKDFPLADSSTKSLSQGEAYVGFDDKTRGAVWQVSENNHAIESARSTALARAFIGALGEIEWTRGSGGKIIGNNEYNRDSEYEGGGGNTVNDEYGPEVVKRRKEMEAAAKLSSYGPYSGIRVGHRL